MKFLMRSVAAGGLAAAVALSIGTAPAHAAAYPAFKAPKVFGTTLQADPGHDFTRRISPRHDGVLRGWITHVRGGTAEYRPIRWQKGRDTEGRFVGPPPYDAMAYASPVARDVEFRSAYGCTVSGGDLTLDRRTGLGARRCSRAVLLKRHAAHRQPALITVYRGKIVKVREIYTP